MANPELFASDPVSLTSDPAHPYRGFLVWEKLREEHALHGWYATPEAAAKQAANALWFFRNVLGNTPEYKRLKRAKAVLRLERANA